MPNFVFAFLIAAGFAIAVYLTTRYMLGNRADILIGGALPLAFFVPPWWAALAGAILGHLVAVMIVRKLLKDKIPKNLVLIAISVVAAYAFGTILTINSVIKEVVEIAYKSKNAEWATFSAQSVASHFVTENYRPCVEATTRTVLAVNTKHDPSVCRSSTVSLAAQTNGQSFGLEVDVAIKNWQARPHVSADADAKISALLASI